jgi:hypothetical protein
MARDVSRATGRASLAEARNPHPGRACLAKARLLDAPRGACPAEARHLDAPREGGWHYC